MQAVEEAVEKAVRPALHELVVVVAVGGLGYTRYSTQINWEPLRQLLSAEVGPLVLAALLRTAATAVSAATQPSARCFQPIAAAEDRVDYKRGVVEGQVEAQRE